MLGLAQEEVRRLAAAVRKLGLQWLLEQPLSERGLSLRVPMARFAAGPAEPDQQGFAGSGKSGLAQIASRRSVSRRSAVHTKNVHSKDGERTSARSQIQTRNAIRRESRRDGGGDDDGHVLRLVQTRLRQ